MVDISRRFFLGGAISLVAAVTFKPSVSAMMNLPTIYGDGKTDDTAGLGALFRSEPVTFKKEQIGIDKHEGLTFHKGSFVISNSIHIPENTKIEIEKAHFIGRDLPDDFPFFICEDFSGKGFSNSLKPGVQTVWEVQRTHKSKFISYPFLEDGDRRKSGFV